MEASIPMASSCQLLEPPYVAWPGLADAHRDVGSRTRESALESHPNVHDSGSGVLRDSDGRGIAPIEEDVHARDSPTSTPRHDFVDVRRREGWAHVPRHGYAEVVRIPVEAAAGLRVRFGCHLEDSAPCLGAAAGQSVPRREQPTPK